MLHHEYGIACDFVFPSRNIKALLKFVKVYLTAFFVPKANAVIIIQKVCSNRMYANMLKLLAMVKSKITLYDLDNAEYLRQDTKTLHFFLKICKTISVGSDALKDYCKDYNDNVVVLTSPVIHHDKQKAKRNEITNIT
jgi:hypothetical protein